MDELANERQAQSWREYLNGIKETAWVFQWVWQQLATPEGKRYSRRFAAAVSAGMFLDVIQSQLLGYAITGQVERKFALVVWGIGGFLLCQTVGKGIDYLEAMSREWLLGHNSGLLDVRLNTLFFEKSLGQHLHESSTLNAANIEKGRGKVQEMHNTILFEGLAAVLSLGFAFMALGWFYPLAGGVMALVLGVHMVWMTVLNQRVLADGVLLDADFRKLNRHRVERWDRVERVGTSAKQGEEIAFMSAFFNDILGRDRRLWFWFIRQSTFRDTVGIAAFAIIASYGSSQVWQGVWSVGALYPLFDWSLRLKNNIWRLGHIEREFHWNIPSVKSMIEALTMAPEARDRDDAAELTPEEPISVRFEGVSHTYPLANRDEDTEPVVSNAKASAPVLRGVSFAIGPGEKVALIGPSGAGKTTVMRLLLRYMDPDAGTITINGRPLPVLKRASWMRALGYIPQSPHVFDGTIRYNLTYGLEPEARARLTDEQLWELMRLLKIDFGGRLINGLDTVVGRSGVKLSGGEAQRLMIGAAAIKQPRFMVIDEATSNLDSSTERAVQEGLRQVLQGGVGALVVAHRLSTVRYLCDTFVVLISSDEIRNGDSQVEAIASSFEQLYVLSPTFRRLADDQGIVLGR